MTSMDSSPRHPRILTIILLALAAGLEASRPQQLTQAAPEPPPEPNSDAIAASRTDDHRSAWSFAVSLFERINRHNISGLAASVAFYAILSIFPAFAALVSIYGLFTSPAHIMDTLSPIASLMPPEATTFLSQALTSIAVKQNSQLSTALIISTVLALWSARAGIASLMSGLDVVYGEVDQRNFILQIIISMLLTFAGIFLALILLLAVAIAPVVLSLVQFGNQLENLILLGRWPLLAVLIALSFAVIYRFAPFRSHPRWRWITWGSATATVLWLLASVIFSYYASNFGNFDATYGSLGAVAVLLMWLWISALVLMFGSEIDAELESREKTGTLVDSV